MRPYDTYRMELLVAFLVRVGLYGGIVAILATLIAGCSPTSPKDVIPSGMSLPPLAIMPEVESRTRNDIPQDGGCHEKSDSSSRRPL
jgi:hypothetical protein